MQFAVDIWNFLWDNQAILVFPIILVIWIVVRGYDLGKWIIQRANNQKADSNEPETPSEPVDSELGASKEEELPIS